MKKIVGSIAAVAISFLLSSEVQAASSEIIKGKFVIDEVDNISQEEQENIIAELQNRFPSIAIVPSALEKQTKIEIAALDDGQIDEAIHYIQSMKNIQHVERLYEQRALGLFNLAKPDDPLYDKQWSFQTVQAEKAWGYNRGEGVVIAVVDTGIDCSLQDFKGVDCRNGWNFIDDTNDSTDDQSHGSHVASTCAEATNNHFGAAGLARNSVILGVKTLNAQGSGSSEGVADGIRWAADHGANVINLSLGGSHSSQVQADAVAYAIEKGVVVVAANGNSGGPIGYPAGYPGVIAVSATDSTNTIADFSSRGPQTFIAAPGVNIIQQTIPNDRGDFPAFSGTSMATPHVAGAAALLISEGVTDPADVKDYLAGSATKTMKTRLDKNAYGAGVLNAGGAVASASQHNGFWRMLMMLMISWMVLDRKVHQWKWQFVLPAVLLGAGLWFLPMFVSFPSPVTFVLSKPLVEVLSLLSVKLTNWLPLANAAVPAVLMAATWHKRNLRLSVAGGAVGVAGYLTQLLWNGTLALPVGGLLAYGFLSINIAVCIYIAKFCLKHLHTGEEPTVDPSKSIQPPLPPTEKVENTDK